MENHINLVNVPLEVMANTIREIVVSELQKVKEFISLTPKEDNSEKILTRDEVCKLLKVSHTTLFNWNNDGILVNHKVGRRVYYSKASVMSMFNNLKTLN
nr:helix-turn-helix domain-containing protein [uncultured Flavobacterium sp.]